MKTYLITQDFTISPGNLSAESGNPLIKYDDSVLVTVAGASITSSTFYAWVGSSSSSDYLELQSSEADPVESGKPDKIVIESNFNTTDIVTKINEVIDAM